MGNSPSVPKLRARDPEGVEAGAVVGGTAVGLLSTAPTPTSCPPNCSCHHILPSRRGGAGSSCGGTRTWDPLWHLSLSAPGASARVPTSSPRQRRALLCHPGLDSGGLGYLFHTPTLPRSGVVGPQTRPLCLATTIIDAEMRCSVEFAQS